MERKVHVRRRWKLSHPVIPYRIALLLADNKLGDLDISVGWRGVNLAISISTEHTHLLLFLLYTVVSLARLHALHREDMETLLELENCVRGYHIYIWSHWAGVQL